MNRVLVNCEIISSYDKGCNYSKFEENYKFTDPRNTTNSKENNTKESHAKEHYNQITETSNKEKF